MTPLRALVSLFALLMWASPMAPALAQSNPEPLRIGFLSVRTGALAAGGKQMEDGINLFLKEHDYMLAGRKVERKDGRLVNAIVAVYPQVTQFWNFDVAKFLAAPVYSREYAPLKP